jgi:predicted alpha/beta superfamily hydrolase
MNFRALAVLCTLGLASPLLTAGGEPKPYQLANTSERIVKSSTGKEFRVMVFNPEGEPPAKGHSITYLLDGDDLFPAMVSLLGIQAGTGKASKHNGISPGIVVGIGYPDKSRRDLDYTPSSPPGPPETYLDGRPYPPRPSGGADEFHSFIEKDLKPLIKREYPVDTSRQTLMGNGYGGLFALHVLFTQPEAFQTYVAASPSIWWNNAYILKEEEAFTKRLGETPVDARVILTVGEMEQSLSKVELAWPSVDEREEHRLKVTRRNMVNYTREMAWRLEALSSKGLKTDFRIFSGETHKSVIPLSINHVLPLVFAPATK